jgi:CRISPR-associated protein Cst2
MPKKNLFASVMTYAAPSSNYRGESEENRTILQKISKNGAEYTVISPESMRNALREILARKGLPTNRSRINDADQLTVEFKDFPNPEQFADDFFFGYLVAISNDIKAARAKNKAFKPKRDSILRMNLAVALAPYRFDATFHQSPINSEKSPWKNASTSALLHREISYTAYQYPFALSMADCLEHKSGKAWTMSLLEAIGELSNVAGGHARSFYEMAPRSIVARLTPSLVAGFNTYGFDESGQFPELERINKNDLPGAEFWVGGEIARHMQETLKKELLAQGVHFFDSPQKLLKELAVVATEE